MRCSVACPVCQTPLTFVKAPNALACPFCRAALKFADGSLPVGKKVQCSKCHGKFTAEAPPSGVFVSTTTPNACPFCRTALEMPPDHLAGKRVKCPQCEMSFLPSRNASTVSVPIRAASVPTRAVEAAVAIAEAPVLRKAASKTRLAPSKSSAELPGGLVGPLNDGSRTPLVKSPALRNSKTQLAPAATMLESIATPELGPPPQADAPPPVKGDAPPSGAARPETKPKPAAARQATAPATPPDADIPPPVKGNAPPSGAARREIMPNAAAARQATASATPPPAPAATPRVRLIIERGPGSDARRATAPNPRPAPPPPMPPRDRVSNSPVPSPHARGRDRAPASTAAQPDTFRLAPLSLQPASQRLLPQSHEPERKARDMPRPKPASRTPARNPAPVPRVRAETEIEKAIAATIAETEARPARAHSAPHLMPSPAPKFAAAKTPGQGGNGLIILIAVVALAALTGGVYVVFFSGAWGPSRRTVYATEGVVMFRGKPAVGARVTLVPEEKSRDRYRPTGTVAADGTFKLTTYEKDDGAPAGKYKAAITRGQISGEEYAEMSAKMTKAELAKTVREKAKDPLYKKYGDSEKTGLTLEIKGQTLNKLERFELK